MKTLKSISFGLLCIAIAVIPSCEISEISEDVSQKQLNYQEKSFDCQKCDPAPTVETWTKTWYDAFGVDYKGSAKVEIAPGVTLEKTKANDHELVFNDAVAGAITLAVKNGNIYKAYTFYTQCSDNYTFDGKNVSGIKYGAFTPCESAEEPEDVMITCTQAYYPTDNVRTIHYAGYSPYGDDDTNFARHLSFCLQSGIWTAQGTPCMIRFYVYFDLSDYHHTEQTLIENTFLYLYAHPTYENHSSNKTNRHVFNRVVGEWEEKTVTWNNQPDVDETTSVITDHIPGTLDEPRRDDYIFNLNDILLENGKLKIDFNGICCRPYQENINDYYRRVTFASRDFEDGAYSPTLKVEYAFPLPKIKFENNVFSVIKNEDIKALFENVQYVWTINDEVNTGESIHFESTADHYTVYLQIIITNNIGEVSEYGINSAF